MKNIALIVLVVLMLSCSHHSIIEQNSANDELITTNNQSIESIAADDKGIEVITLGIGVLEIKSISTSQNGLKVSFSFSNKSGGTLSADTPL